MQCKWAEELYWSFQYHGIWAAWLEKQLHTPKCTHHGKWYTLRFDNQSDGFPVSLQTMWAEETAAEGTWRMGTCLDGTEWETHSRTESFMLRFPVYCLRSVVHLRHENLNSYDPLVRSWLFLQGSLWDPAALLSLATGQSWSQRCFSRVQSLLHFFQCVERQCFLLF